MEGRVKHSDSEAKKLECCLIECWVLSVFLKPTDSDLNTQHSINQHSTLKYCLLVEWE